MYDQNGNWIDEGPTDPYGGDQGPTDPYNLNFGDSTTVTGTNPGEDPWGLPNGGGQGAGPWYDPSGQLDPSQGQGGYDPGGVPWYKKLWNAVNNQSPLTKGAEIGAIGDVLKALLAKPTFQQKFPFTGGSNAQNMMDQFRGMGDSLLPTLQNLTKQGNGAQFVKAQTPVGLRGQDPGSQFAQQGGQPNEIDQVRQILGGLK